MKIGIIAITSGGLNLAEQLLSNILEDAALIPIRSGVKEGLARSWSRFDGFVCIMAAGIVVRAIAPLLQDKRSDPCVVVIDEKGENVISLLSGHLGGGNALATRVAGLTGGKAVITTASDVLGLVSLDGWARTQNLAAESSAAMTTASAKLVDNGCLRLYAEVDVESLPEAFIVVERPEEADIIVSDRTCWQTDALLLHPRDLVVGVGCNRGTPGAELAAALEEFLATDSFSRLSVRNLASIDLKRDESGLLEFARKNSWDIVFYTKEELNSVAGITPSAAAHKATGAKGVA
ncbi:MAG: cobalamin biosynthesis protein, partial [Desulfobulbaceae bacterium]|nr:cobalamin biosynthesis protein [Desulfobulbaceae bacterium]